MSGRRPTTPSTGVTVSGVASVLSLSATAALGLWLELAYRPDARTAWDSIEELQDEIELGLFVADLRRLLGVVAVGVTMVWFAVMLVARRRLGLVIALALGLSLAAWATALGSTAGQRSLFECGAAAVGVMAFSWLVKPMIDDRAGSTAPGNSRVGSG